MGVLWTEGGELLLAEDGEPILDETGSVPVGAGLGSAPGIRHLLDHTARVWRPDSALGALGAEVRAYEPGAIVLLAQVRPAASTGDPGPGLAQQGTRQMFLEPSADVRAFDVLELLTGPDAPGTWEVDSPPTRPRGHHVELTARLFLGTLKEPS
jgi:hypothetical protein